jgi:hypothetical protein
VLHTASYVQRQIETGRADPAGDVHGGSRQAPSLSATATPPDDHLGGSDRRRREKSRLHLPTCPSSAPPADASQDAWKRFRRTYHTSKNTLHKRHKSLSGNLLSLSAEDLLCLACISAHSYVNTAPQSTTPPYAPPPPPPRTSSSVTTSFLLSISQTLSSLAFCTAEGSATSV